MNAYDTIRAAIDHYDADVCAKALAALAELEKAAAEPSRWECEYANGNDETMVDVLPFPPEDPSFYDSITPLYTTPPPAPVADEGKLWSLIRKVMQQGVDIHIDHCGLGYEKYSARLDAAASERIADFAKLNKDRTP